MTNTYRFADVNVRITVVHPVVYSLFNDYRVCRSADFSIVTDPADIEAERVRAKGSGYSGAYLETLAVLRKIAERMPEYDTFLFHASAIAVDGEAYVFTARSGTGKSTHTRLWRELLGGRAMMVNDDKPLLRIHPDGTAIVYGTPWDGKHHLSNNIAVPVRALCILERSVENRIHPITKAEALPMLFQQAYRPAGREALMKTLTLIDRLNVKLYRLGCNMELSAAKISCSAMMEK